MKRVHPRALAALVLCSLAAAATLLAHITPPVILMSEREAVQGLLASAKKFSVRELRLTSGEKRQIEQQWHWKPTEDFYRFYMGRDAEGKLLGAVIFVTDYTIHGPVQVAVGIGPDGKVSGAHVIEVSEETYSWVKPLVDLHFSRWYVGQDCKAHCEAMQAGIETLHPMCHFYAEILTSLVQRGSILYDVGVARRDAKT